MEIYKKGKKIKRTLYISLHILMIGIFLSIILKYYIDFSEYEYIWFNSKILTMKQIIKNNNENYRTLFFIKNSQKYYFTDLFYLKLLKYSSKKGCLHNYKKCGVLDTYGNNFCLSQKSDCPITEIIFDSSSKLSEYNQNIYSYFTVNDSPDNLYYKYGAENKGIIVNWTYTYSQPKYIDENNFIFDYDAFYEIFDIPEYDKSRNDIKNTITGKEIIDGNIQFAGTHVNDSAKLSKIYKLIDYIKEKIYKDEKNIDYNYTFINHEQ